MLIISRKPQQQIVLETSDGPVTILYVGPTEARARLGIDAPQSIKIHWPAEIIPKFRDPRQSTLR